MASFADTLYTQGTRVWVPQGVDAWVPGIVAEDEQAGGNGLVKAELVLEEEDDNNEDDFETTSGKVVEVSKAGLLIRNPKIQDGVDDLTTLSYMHDPAILHALHLRYRLDMIYSYAGPILIALNPYKDLGGLYSKEMMDAYVGQAQGNLSPHVFAIAEEAFRTMRMDRTNQSILVSGESGAGKTETTKYVLRYLAAMASATSGVRGGTKGQLPPLAHKVLESTPLLEAFGNSRTRFNNNSSRFGKFIEIWFSNESGSICASALRTYLLEKSRVVRPPVGERNFHFFYQLLAGADAQLRAQLKLKRPEEYAYLAESECYTVEDVDDSRVFKQTLNAMRVIGLNEKEQQEVFKVVAAVLHLGNVQFTEDSKESANLADEKDPDGPTNNASLNIAAELLGCSAADFAKSMRERTITAGGPSGQERLTTPLNKAKAEQSRDALAMLLYSSLFDWIVLKINSSLHEDSSASTSHSSSSGSSSSISSYFGLGGSGGSGGGGMRVGKLAASREASFIGILDIYGFESFETNGFPQFCINYANEKLQQHFNQHIFKFEQKEYIKEKIDWSYINFSDNQGCIDLLENKPMCLLSLLDEECRFPNGSDASFAAKVRKTHKEDDFFAVPRFSQTGFTVKHYAGDVTYETKTGFLDRNKDVLVPAHPLILQASSNPFVKALLSAKPAAPTTGAGGGGSASPAVPGRLLGGFGFGKAGGSGTAAATARSGTGVGKSSFQFVGVITQFKESLSLLMDSIGATQPHFVRCIKPNLEQRADLFVRPLVLNQLRCGGVMEAVRISSAGYPSRTSYAKIYDRYKNLVKHTPGQDDRESCMILFEALGIPAIERQFGSTKLFLKSGMIAHLEKVRTIRLNWAAAVFQKNWRRIVTERWYVATRIKVIRAQAQVRVFLAKLEKVRLRKNRAAIVLQKYARAWLGRRQYKSTVHAAVLFQSIFRGAYAKKKEEERLRREEEQRRREAEDRRLEECRQMKAEDHYSRAMAKEWKRQAEEQERLRQEEAERQRIAEEERRKREEEERRRARREEKLRRQEEEKRKAREMEQKMKQEIMKGDQQQKELLDQLNELQQRHDAEVEQKDKQISKLERKHEKELANITAAMQQQSDEATERARRVQEEVASELERLNREWQRKLDDVAWKAEQERQEWERERAAWAAERAQLAADVDKWKRANEELEAELKVMEERQKGIVLEAMNKQDEEIETMATLVAGSTDEGRKRLLGLVLAEERGFVSGMPVPAVVSFRFLRHWGELSLYLSANQQSYLLPYTINNFRALIQSNLHDNSLLAYFTSNILLMLHLLRKELAHIAFTKTKRTRGHERSFSSLSSSPRHRRSLSVARIVDAALEGGASNDADADAADADAYVLHLPPLDNSIVNPYLLWNKLEEENLVTEPQGKEADGDAVEEAEALVDEGPTEGLPPVKWFERELRRLLRTALTLIHNNLRSALRNVLQKAVFESPLRLKNPPQGSRQRRPSKSVDQVPEEEEEEGYISIEQMTTMIDYYQSSSPFSSKDDSRAKTVNMISVISILNYFLYVLQSNFIDFAIVKQFFEHTFSFIDAFLFDILLLRKDLCSRNKGYEIRVNMRKLERWAEETGADWVGRAGSCLGHIQQATGVLLMSYAEKRQLCTDLNTRRAKCASLNVFQIRQLLSMYTPDVGEDKIPLDLMARLYEGVGGSSGSGDRAGRRRPRQLPPPADQGALLIDSAVVGEVSIATMHYVECKDVLALPLPQTIKQSLQAHEKEKEEELRKLQQRADEDVKKKRRLQSRKSMVFW